LGAINSGATTSKVTCGYETISSAGATGTRTATAVGNSNSNLGFSVLLKAANTGFQIDLGTVWTNDSTRSLALTTQDGVYVNSTTFSGLINGVAIVNNTGRYLGTIRTTGTTTTEDSVANRNVYNLAQELRPTTGASRVTYDGYVTSTTRLGGPVSANTLTGNTLASNVLTSSLTTIGTLTSLQLNGTLSLGSTTDAQLSRSSAGMMLVSNPLTTGGTGVAGLIFSSQDATALQTLGSDTYSWSTITDSSRLAKRVITVNSYNGAQTALTITALASSATVTCNGNFATPNPPTLTPITIAISATATALTGTGFPAPTVKLTSSGAYAIQGISATNVVDGMIIRFWNTNTTGTGATLTFQHNNSGASAANRIWNATAADFAVVAGDYFDVQYDATLGAWRGAN
jgi:hypothetical protein